jgi:hypothetical protein
MGSSGIVISDSTLGTCLMASYIIEKLGGFAGFGGPSARIRSIGRINFSTLDETDQKILSDLVSGTVKLNQNYRPDEFRFRITTDEAEQQLMIELPESLTPLFIKNCVRDELV